jgi:hypothetical protein
MTMPEQMQFFTDNLQTGDCFSGYGIRCKNTDMTVPTYYGRN